MLKELLRKIVFKLQYIHFLDILPDKPYLRLMYYANTFRRLSLKNPKTFNEKLQWLKLYDRKTQYTQMVDKYEAKAYVKERIGECYIIPTYGVYNRPEEIDYSQLPSQFVLKCTHDSGGLCICRDKEHFSKEQAAIKLNKSLNTNYYYNGREWPYKNVKPRIIAEAYLEDEEGAGGLTDYKFYCFNGKVELLYVSSGLEDHSTASISFLTKDWQFAPFTRTDYKPYDTLPKKPACLQEMIAVAEKLSAGIRFLRVDLYEVKGKVYFSELTFFPCSGYMPFSDERYNQELGDLIVL